ncbi:hypothetical protein EBS02_11450 [bacterium]|jgi:hypothetical protein|nr:hypothetical protein [bacterium]
MSSVGDNNPVPSYKDEFKKGLELFEESFQAYQQSNIANQKLAFQDVMGKATHIMDETSDQCLSASGKKNLSKLKSDYDQFLKNPNSEIMKAIQSDLNNLKSS